MLTLYDEGEIKFIIWSQILIVKSQWLLCVQPALIQMAVFACTVYVFHMVVRRVIVLSYCGDPEFNARPHRNRLGIFGLYSTGLGHEPGADSS
jgi:hypothetical protein